MSESHDEKAASLTSSGDSAVAAGAFLRKARQAQGLHIAALAASIKVSPRKLEALESGRFDELPDLTFARALALTVCRSLKIDSAPVMAMLPQPGSNRLAQVSDGLNTPFRDKPGRSEPRDLMRLISPAIWGPALLLLAAVVVYFAPGGWFRSADGGDAVEPPSTTASEALPSMSIPLPSSVAPDAAGAIPQAGDAPQPASGPEIKPLASEPKSALASVAAPAGVDDSLLQLKTRSDSWIEVIDGKDQVLLARSVKPGELVSLNGPLPFKVKIGNAAATEMSFRGQAVDLNALARENVAKLELN